MKKTRPLVLSCHVKIREVYIIKLDNDASEEKKISPSLAEKGGNEYMKRTRKILGLLLCCVMLAGLLPNVVSAAQSGGTFTVKKVDQDGQPLAGATFVLTIDNPDNTAAEVAYEVRSDSKGIATFSDVSTGSYILSESAAPEGYVKSDETYSLYVKEESGEVFLYTEEYPNGILYSPVTFENQKIAQTPTETSIELPFTKIVEQTGERTPDKQTFEFEVFDFLNESGAVTVTGNTIETNGKGSYKGTLKLTFTDESYKYNSFCVREKKGTADGWTYSDEVWCVVYNQATDGYDLCKVVNGEAQLNDPQAEMTFTNSYCAKKVLAAETGDMSNMLIWTVLLLTGCFAVIKTTVYKRRYQK